jgi:hypothetical protein
MESSPSLEPISNITPEELANFKEHFTTALEESLDFFTGDDFLVLHPLNLTEDDPRSMDELSREEQSALAQMLSEHLEVDLNNVESVIDSYEFEGPLKDDQTRSIVKVSVIATNREEIFIHKAMYENGDILYIAGPKDLQFS